MGKLALTLLRSIDLSMAYIPCCAFVLMKHNYRIKLRFNEFYTKLKNGNGKHRKKYIRNYYTIERIVF